MELRLLQAFVHVARESSFSNAAAFLSITQPALTKQIQALESVVGLTLFRRGRHGAELTAAGTALLDEARTIVDLVVRLEERARRVARGEEGHLTVGFGLSSITIAPRIVAAFRKRSPGVSVRLEDLPSSAQLEGVERGRLDIAFTRLPVSSDLRTVPVLSDRLAFVFPAEWEPPPRESQALRRWLADQPLIRLSTGRGPGLAGQVSRFLADVGAQPASVQDTDDLQTVLALVAAAAGVGIVPESARHIAPRRVKMTPLTGRRATWTVGAVWRSDNETPAVRGFLDELANVAAV
ncbi:LysR family transcriptional regulator [Agromyces aerolatus]|uniref:LysR family transcriptional regulator n=1 Tax=Agromyces sp. LY-1074 TaxID=3074080 RepID=UPI00286390B2|nr:MULTISPECIES: LysR substrate-binding domain-containing protein [unclassified Agromyces]MDR5700948.1 LysR substrate-binding domain-containing protein [Agromyces sp. LY-1074]MDR5707391.1 LysR substrate-binding domain-containing protein [Agromyces sp. LY-1358]